MQRLRAKRFREAYPQLERIAKTVRNTKRALVAARREFTDVTRENREIIDKCRRLRGKQWRTKFANRRARRALGLASIPIMLEGPPLRVTRRRGARRPEEAGEAGEDAQSPQEPQDAQSPQEPQEPQDAQSQEEEEEEEVTTQVVIALGEDDVGDFLSLDAP